MIELAKRLATTETISTRTIIGQRGRLVWSNRHCQIVFFGIPNGRSVLVLSRFLLLNSCPAMLKSFHITIVWIYNRYMSTSSKYFWYTSVTIFCIFLKFCLSVNDLFADVINANSTKHLFNHRVLTPQSFYLKTDAKYIRVTEIKIQISVIYTLRSFICCLWLYFYKYDSQIMLFIFIKKTLYIL